MAARGCYHRKGGGCSVYDGALPTRFKSEALEKAEEFDKRANLVEQMRCETCRRWHPNKRWKNCEDRECLYGKNGVQYSAPDFYCCDWEGKG